MKTKTIFVWLLFISCLAHSQNYKIFNASLKKLFTDSVNAYSISFDSVKASGNDSIYFNFLRLDDTLFQSDSCNFWGPPDCYKQNKAVWTGEKVTHDNLGVYQFYTLAGDTLNFDFTINIGDTSLFYKDGIQRFLFVFEKADTLTILNYFDSVRSYKILHTDLAGNSINSQLNGEKIIIGKNLGLVQLFQIDSFPQILKFLYLIGNKSPAGGLFQLTNEMIYDYLPGDEIQFHDYYYYPSGPPWLNYSRYIKYAFINKTLTADSMIYTAIRTVYDVYALQTTTDTITLKYYRYTIIAQIPFEYFDGNNRSLYVSDYCSMKLWTYKVSPTVGLGYCSAENCWGWVDTNGPPLISSITYVIGLGIYSNGGSVTAPPPYGYSYGTYIVYFKKNSIPCGTEVVMGINPNDFLFQINIFPNPFTTSTTLQITNDKLRITNLSEYANYELKVFDVFGKEVNPSVIRNSEGFVIRKCNLSGGIYVYKIINDNSTIATGKLIIE